MDPHHRSTTLTLVVLLIIALQVTGFSTPYWQYEVQIGYMGLFTSCKIVEVLDRNYCTNDINAIFKLPNDWVRVVISVESIAIILQVLAVVFLLTFHWKTRPNGYAKVSFLILVVAGILGSIGVIVYGVKADTDKLPLNWSFAFELVASCLGVIVGGLGYYFFMKPPDYLQIN
ncbi:hypothetical protein SNE40_021925 [Patella caerulea]|uniref:Uncharacterized protein n=1 Tax=Patella caerulea TaxID=87958 RepID=A0AAN8IYF1_PATCE